MHLSGIFDLYNPANRDQTKANIVLLIRFRSGRSKLMKLLDQIRSIYGRTVRSLVLVLSVITVVLLLLGQGKPPMFGDYEAQRHWMEITYNLPLSHW